MISRVAQDLKAPGSRPEAQLEPLPGDHLEALLSWLSRELDVRGFCPRETPLERLHEVVDPEAQVLDANYLNSLNVSFYNQGAELQRHYRRLVEHVTREWVGEPVYYQAQPILRFHFPTAFPGALTAASGFAAQFHSDTLGGHPFGMIQGWLALTDCGGTSTLQVCNVARSVGLLERFANELQLDDASYGGSLLRFYHWVQHDESVQAELLAAGKRPELRAGDLLLFDPRSLHGGHENREPTTRVSLDFRLLPRRRYEQLAREGRLGRFRRGEVLAEDVITPDAS